MTYTSNPVRDADNYHAEQAQYSESIQATISEIADSQSDVIEAFSQCSAALSFEQEERLHKAYSDNDSLELGLMLRGLINNQITEMAEAIRG